MAHVIKVERATKDGKKRHAWKVRYRDPDRVERARTFTKKTDAENFASSIETDILRGDGLHQTFRPKLSREIHSG